MGVALLLLRLCAGGSLLAAMVGPDLFGTPSWMLVAVAAILVLLGVGFLTPVTCVIAALIEAYYISHHSGIEQLLAVIGLMLFVALTLLGPGAFSVDARLFGRRLIIPDED